MSDYVQKDLVGVALEMARRKEADYRQLATEMARYHNREAAEMLELLADQGELHEQAIIKNWQKTQGTDANLPKAALPSEIDAGKEAEFPFYLTPHGAVCYALEHERKAFDFFTNLAAHATDQTTRETAEYFAKEEISHIAGLRLARIKANRKLREFRQSLGWWRDPASIEDIDGLHHCLAAMETALASLYDQTAKILITLGRKKEAAALQHFTDEAARHASDLNPGITEGASPPLVETDEPMDALLRALKITDQALDLTFMIAEKSINNEVLEAATAAAERLSKRVNSIGNILKDIIEDD